MIPQRARTPGAPPPTPVWRVALGWILAAVSVYLFVWLVRELGSRLRPRSFAILYPENGLTSFLIGVAVLIGVLLLTSYIGKLWGQRTRRGRKISYLAVLGDQFTHVFFWAVMLIALYPIFYVAAASFDPLNTLVSASLGSPQDQLLVRARVIPDLLRGKDFSNYAKLFDGLVIYTWQWAVLGLAGLAVLGIAVLWVLVQRNGGATTPRLRRARGIINIVIGLGVVGFLSLLSPGQFGGYGNESKFLLWIRNTLLISGTIGIIAIVLTSTSGYALARLRFPGRFQVLLTFIFIQMFPGFLGLIATYNLISGLGLANTFTGLILAYSGGVIAFGTWLYKGYVESLPASLEEAALVDGCTRWSAYWRIVLPLSGPMLVFIFLNQFIGTYAEFLLANIILTGATSWNVGVGLRSFQSSQFATNYGPFAAAAVLGSLPIVLLFYAFQQVFVSGTVSGGVKE